MDSVSADNQLYSPNTTTNTSTSTSTSNTNRSRKRKSISWQSDDKLLKIHHFELIADERINVARVYYDPQNDTNASQTAASSNASGVKISNASVDPVRRPSKNESDLKCIDYLPWRPLILIDFTPELPPPGWNSKERSAQAERESCVLGAIDLPGQSSTLDEPEQQSKSGSSESNKEDPNATKEIPSESADGIYVEYPEMYSIDSQQNVNQNVSAYCSQSQMVPNQMQQQMVNTTQNPFMWTQFQQAQIPVAFPFQGQPPPPQQQQQQQLLPRFQTTIVPQIPLQPVQPSPFIDQQPGPIMPWLNQTNENSHAHLFRRPAT